MDVSTPRRGNLPWSRRGALGRLCLAGLLLAILAPRTWTTEDDARWDPPIDGTFLGIRGAIDDGVFRVALVNPGGAAHLAGLRRGDAIVGLAGRAGFADFDEFRRIVGSLEPGEPTTAVVSRGGSELDLALVPDHGAFRDFFVIVDRIRTSRFTRGLDTTPGAIEAILEEDATRLRRADRWSAAYEILNRSIGRLRVSHAAVVPPWTYERIFLAGPTDAGSHRPGIVLAALESEESSPRPAFFVLTVLDGSPAARAGLRRGDEIVRVNERPTAESPRRTLAGYEFWRPYYVLQVDPGEELALDVRRTRGGELEDVRVVIDEPISELAATRESVSTLVRDGRRIVSIHLWDFLSPRLPALVKTALTEGAASDGLLIDLRGRGGKVSVLEQVLELLRADPRPRVLLIDRDTRSAKEILADALLGSPRTRLVGERTAGAVLPASFRSLSRSAALMFPADPRVIERLVGDRQLEGVGVSPDIEVEVSLPYSGGADPIRDRGIDALLALIDEATRRARF